MKNKGFFSIAVLVLLLGGLSCNQSSNLNGGDTGLDPSQIESPVKNHLVAQWLFEGDAMDSSGNGHDGTVDGAILTNDRFGTPNKAYWFDGTSDSIEADIPAYVFKGDFTLSFWAKIDHFGNVYATMVSSRNYNFLFQALGDGIGDVKLYCPEFYFYDHITQAHIGKTTSAFRMKAGEWNFYTAVRKGDASTLIVNACDRSPTVIADPKEFAQTIDHLFFARTDWGRAPEYYPGTMDDIRLYDKALNINEIKALYKKEKDINNPKE